MAAFSCVMCDKERRREDAVGNTFPRKARGNAQERSSQSHPSLDYSHSGAICCVPEIKCNYWRI